VASSGAVRTPSVIEPGSGDLCVGVTTLERRTSEAGSGSDSALVSDGEPAGDAGLTFCVVLGQTTARSLVFGGGVLGVAGGVVVVLDAATTQSVKSSAW
jgi:hypothetical protein